MNTALKWTAVFCAALLASSTLAKAETMLTDAAGMTLYTFDKDTGGASSCYDDCAAKWPPYLGKEGDAMTEGWTMTPRTDGAMQWAYDGKPVYLYSGDTTKGDAMGDGLGDVWHVIKE